MNHTLRLLAGELSIVRLPADAAIPVWFSGTAGPLTSITRTAHELSIVCPSAQVPPAVACEAAFRAFTVEGKLDFSAIGVLAGIVNPLADAGISLFSISTFDTDYILVRSPTLPAATAALGQRFKLIED